MTGAGLTFLTQVVLARSLGVEQFGAFSAALAVSTLLAPLAGFGVSGYWLSVFGREGWTALRWIPGSFSFLAFSITVVLLMCLAWAWAGPHTTTTSWLLTVLTVHIVSITAVELVSAKFQLEGHYGRLAYWQAMPHLLRFAAVILLSASLDSAASPAIQVAVAYSAVAIIVMLTGGPQIRLMAKGRFALEGHPRRELGIDSAETVKPGAWQVMSAAWPFGLAGLFYLVYFQSDIILLKYMVSESAAGIYNVAFVVMVAVYLFPGVIAQKFLLPKLHRWAHHETGKLHKAYRLGNVIMLSLGVAATVFIWIVMPTLLPFVFGAEYLAAVALLMVLAIAAPFRFLSLSLGALLSTRNLIRTKVRLMAVAALLNVVMNLMLIPKHGPTGAAWATVITEGLLLIAYVITWNKVAPGMGQKVV